MNETMKHVGDALRIAREKKGIMLKQVRYDKGLRHVANIECGSYRRNINLKTLVKIASIYEARVVLWIGDTRVQLS